MFAPGRPPSKTFLALGGIMRPNWTVYTRMLLVVAIACLASVARADDKKDGDKKEGEKKPKPESKEKKAQ